MLQPTNAVVELSRAAPVASVAGASSSSPSPLYNAALRLRSLELCATPDQLALLSAASSYLGSSQQYELWRRFRPLDRVRPVDGPSARLWWRAVGQAIGDEIGRRRPRFDWSLLQARREERRRYVQLHTTRLRGATVDRAALVEMERTLPVEMILFYRQVPTPNEATLGTPPPPPGGWRSFLAAPECAGANPPCRLPFPSPTQLAQLSFEKEKTDEAENLSMSWAAQRVGGFLTKLKRQTGMGYGGEASVDETDLEPLEGATCLPP